VEARRAGVALTTGAATELVVDAARLVPLGADDVEAAGFEHLVVFGLPLVAVAILWLATENDVGAAAGHVGRDRDGALAAGFGDDRGLALVLFGVEHFQLDAAPAQQFGQELRLFHRDGANQHRPAALGLL